MHSIRLGCTELITSAFTGVFVCVVLGLSPTVQAQQLQIGINPVNFGVFIWRETNAYRASQGQPGLQFAPRNLPLMQAAQKYAEYQARTNTTGHNADGQDPGQRIVAEGFQHCYWSENVYEQWNAPTLTSWQNAAEGAMRFWQNSPEHASNMRDARAKYLGVGVAAWKHGDRNYYKVVQVFADDCQPPPPPPHWTARQVETPMIDTASASRQCSPPPEQCVLRSRPESH